MEKANTNVTVQEKMQSQKLRETTMFWKRVMKNWDSVTKCNKRRCQRRKCLAGSWIKEAAKEEK
jgi:hypothetical protein